MKKEVYIFGAGEFGKELLIQLNGKVEVAAYIDNDENKKGWGVECISVDEAIARGAQNSVVLVSVVKNEDIVKQLKQKNFTKVFCVAKWIRERTYFTPDIMYPSDYSHAVPFNRYDSPYPDIIEVHKKETEIFDTTREVLDIDFNVDRQLELVKEMDKLEIPEWPTDKNSKYRYYYNNSWFFSPSAHALCYMMRILLPKRIIEVGSGYSTAVMLDTNEAYFANKVEITCVEPRADRLKALIRPGDNIDIYESDLQEIPVDFFEKLDEDDILFIDSSHVSKINSDVNYIFFEILPRLKRGVYIHFHDIFYPFIYPKEQIYLGILYNEMYILRAFLMNNKEYSIQLFGQMLGLKYREHIPEKLLGCGAGSIWIKKN